MRISIILPTYNEKKNIKKIASRISAVLPKAELVIVDDNSPDGTGRIADDLAKIYNIKVVHRKKRLGLSSAIAAGFRAAKGGIIGVMDVDLSHPPEILPKLIEPITNNKADFVIGSRYMKGGGVEVWPWHRKLVSLGATLMAWPLTSVKDPMSGLFFLKRNVIDGVEFASKGYKICLEIIVKGKYKRTMEIPYMFRDRADGGSKLNTKEYFNYVVDWFRLVIYKILLK